MKFIQTCFFLFYVLYCSYFWHLPGNSFQHLLENNQLRYSLHCSLLTPHVWIVRQVHLQDQYCQSIFKLITISLANKIVQNNTGLNNDNFKVRTDIKRSLENSPFIAQNSKSTIHIPSCSAQAIGAHSFFNTQVRSTKRSKYISV